MKGCPAHPMQSCRWSSHMEKRMLGCLVIMNLRKGLVSGQSKKFICLIQKVLVVIAAWF